MKIDKAGLPFIAGALVPAAALVAARRYGWAASFAAAGAFLTYFFRDPDRQIPDGADLSVAPADGRIMVAGAANPRWAPPGTWNQVTIFLSPLDVHINRAPGEGRITRIEYRPGRFLPAYREDASENELNEIWIERGGDTIVVRQIVGVLARRIVCRVHEGQQLARGERIGLMKFGSRMDVFFPPTYELTVSVGQQAVGGETVIAKRRRHDGA